MRRAESRGSPGGNGDDEMTTYEREARAAGWHWALNFGSGPDCPRHDGRNAWAASWRDAWEQEQLYRIPEVPATRTRSTARSASAQRKRPMIVRALLAYSPRADAPISTEQGALKC